MAKCKGCGAEIIWIQTELKKAAPVDAKESTFYIVDTLNVGRIRKGHEPHFATCPKADKFRKPKRG